MTTISAYLPGPDDKSVQVPIPDAANQRESWLRQMELAQLNSMGAAGGAITHEARAHGRAPAVPMQMMPQPRDSDAGERTAPADDKAATRTRKDRTETELAAEAAPQAQHGEHQAHAEQARAAVEVAGAVIATQAPVQPVAAMAAPAQPATVQTPASLLAAAAQAGLHGAAPAAADGTVTATRSAAQRDLLRPALGSSPKLPAEEIEMREGAEPQAEQAAAEQPEEMPAWQKRMMHINGTGDDVKLFIRDSELGQAESMSLIYRIAGDMASMGLRLRGAMVNGKPALRGVLPHGATTSFEQDMESQTTAVTQPGGHHGSR